MNYIFPLLASYLSQFKVDQPPIVWTFFKGIINSLIALVWHVVCLYLWIFHIVPNLILLLPLFNPQKSRTKFSAQECQNWTHLMQDTLKYIKLKINKLKKRLCSYRNLRFSVFNPLQRQRSPGAPETFEQWLWRIIGETLEWISMCLLPTLNLAQSLENIYIKYGELKVCTPPPPP